MSATSSLSAPAASATSNCGAKLYDIPTKDAACALPSVGNYTDIMSACCGPADVVSYYDGCGLYCLAVDQTIDELTACIFDRGAYWGNGFCNTDKGNATATAADAALPTSAGASVVATHGSSEATRTSGSTESTDESSSSTDTPGSAAGPRPEVSISTLGLTIGALLFSATAIGAFQL